MCNVTEFFSHIVQGKFCNFVVVVAVAAWPDSASILLENVDCKLLTVATQ
jgi:hypothetical protein